MLVRVADERLVNVPLSDPLRKALLEDALRFYGGFSRQKDESDVSLQLDTVEVLRKVSTIQRELGRSVDARRTQERTIEVLRSLVDSDPTEPVYREHLADAHTYLAFIVHAPSSIENYVAEEAHLREALQIYDELERDFPHRPLNRVGQLSYWPTSYSAAILLRANGFIGRPLTSWNGLSPPHGRHSAMAAGPLLGALFAGCVSG